MASDDDVLAELTALMRGVFLRDDLALTPATTAKDVPGWDSYKQVEIIMAVEEHYGLKFHTRDLDRLESVADLVRTVQARCG